MHNTAIEEPQEASPRWRDLRDHKFALEKGRLSLNGRQFQTSNEEIIRTVNSDGYTANFSLQWNRFSKIQIDQYHKGADLSKKRFTAVTGWDFASLRDLRVLEVGCGAGRFSKVVLENSQAHLFSIDYSESVLANYLNNGPNDRLFLFQSDVYDLPFQPHQFDKIFCFGVLQFTPDPTRTISELAKMLRPGGELVLDFFAMKGLHTKIHAKYLLRPITKRLTHDRLLSTISTNINWMIRLYDFLDKLGLGKVLNRFIPICDLNTTLPPGLSPSERKEWAILDTLNMFSPKYEKPQRLNKVKTVIQKLGLQISYSGYVEYVKGNKVAVVRATYPVETI